MEKVNIKPFISGDRVYYVGNDNNIPKNKILIVDDCYPVSCGCNCEWVVSLRGLIQYTNQGSPLSMFLGKSLKCDGCGKMRKTVTGFEECRFDELRPAQELNVPSMTFTKVAEVEKEEVLILN